MRDHQCIVQMLVPQGAQLQDLSSDNAALRPAYQKLAELVSEVWLNSQPGAYLKLPDLVILRRVLYDRKNDRTYFVVGTLLTKY